MAKEYVPLYLDFCDTTQDLSDEQVGKLIRAIVAYANGEEYSLQGAELIAFRFMKGYIDRNDALSKVRAEAGAKGGHQTAANRSNGRQNEIKDSKNTINIDSISNMDTNMNTDNIIKTVAADDAAQDDQSQLIKAAEKAGFRVSESVRDELLALLKEHGLEKMLDGIRSCSEHDALNLAYLRAVLTSKPKAQDFAQRDYSGVESELLTEVSRDIKAMKAGEKYKNPFAEYAEKLGAAGEAG